MKRSTLIAQTKQVATSTLVSRLLGLARELLMGRYLGIGADAFITAFKIPNSLRKIFAEGALSAAFIPTLSKLVKKGKRDEVDQLVSLAFIIFEGILLIICFFLFIKADLVMKVVVPGWFHNGIADPQVVDAVRYLRILVSFILFLSMSALLTGALQAVHHFFIPAFAPILLNVVFIAGLLSCMKCGFSTDTLCYFIVAGGLVQFLAHIYMYWKLNFSFKWPTKQAFTEFSGVLLAFLPMLLSMSIMEINLFIDTSFGSYLHAGSISSIYYANRFMQIPLGVFATALSTITLPYFSRLSTYAPKRLSFLLHETTKLIFWVTVPLTLVMCFFSHDIFTTLFLSPKFPLAYAQEAGTILQIFLSGLFFFSLSKILLNIYYALRKQTVPTIITVIEVTTNTIFDYLLVWTLGAAGICGATVISGVLRTILLAAYLPRLGIFIHIKSLSKFAAKALLQVAAITVPFWLAYKGIFTLMPSPFFTDKIGLWLWVAPLCILYGITLLKSRRLFGINLYLLES